MKPSQIAGIMIGAIALGLLIVLLSGANPSNWKGTVTLEQSLTSKVDLARSWPTSLQAFASAEIAVNGICLGLSRQDVERLLSGKGYSAEMNDGRLDLRSPLGDVAYTVDRKEGVVGISLINSSMIPSDVRSAIVRWDLGEIANMFGQYGEVTDPADNARRLIALESKLFGERAAAEMAEMTAVMAEIKWVTYVRGLTVIKEYEGASVFLSWPGRHTSGEWR